LLFHHQTRPTLAKLAPESCIETVRPRKRDVKKMKALLAWKLSGDWVGLLFAWVMGPVMFAMAAPPGKHRFLQTCRFHPIGSHASQWSTIRIHHLSVGSDSPRDRCCHQLLPLCTLRSRATPRCDVCTSPALRSIDNYKSTKTRSNQPSSLRASSGGRGGGPPSRTGGRCERERGDGQWLAAKAKQNDKRLTSSCRPEGARATCRG
jgi:hypothetical protein